MRWVGGKTRDRWDEGFGLGDRREMLLLHAKDQIVQLGSMTAVLACAPAWRVC